ncbi:hypothetical protein BI344_05460 [Chromobacterium sphagni]|uniref:Beta-carotene 15,15'-dioxygenase n=1 Tax=Chromobacterium sphagni TaxID=1903179 RepID=A0ABX3CIZ4_9NEIS|nr:hypothetical protein BI344_05460 [Chromobacterium sphagni]
MRPPWFFNLRADAAAILLAGPLVSLALYLAVQQRGPSFLLCALAFALLLDLPHVLHTYIRLFANPADFHRHRQSFWRSLLILALLCSALGTLGQYAILVTIWVYWQPYHVCKQHFGVATLYARKSGYKHSTRHVLLLLICGFAAPLLYRLCHGGFRFGQYQLFGQSLPFSGLQVYTPPLPAWSAGIGYAVFGLAALVYMAREYQAARRAAGLPRFVNLMLAIVLILYNAAYLLISDLYALILIATSVHAIQYHLVCASTVRNLYAQPSEQDNAASPLLHALQRGVRYLTRHPLAWCGALLMASLLVLCSELPTLGILPLIVVLHHFYLDGVIWKRS